MPELPFTFEDVKNFNPQTINDDADRVRAEAQKAENINIGKGMGRAQAFLKSKLGEVKGHLQSVDGAMDVAMAVNPVLRYTDMASKFFGGPGVHKGFVDGVNFTGETRVPPNIF